MFASLYKSLAGFAVGALIIAGLSSCVGTAPLGGINLDGEFDLTEPAADDPTADEEFPTDAGAMDELDGDAAAAWDNAPGAESNADAFPSDGNPNPEGGPGQAGWGNFGAEGNSGTASSDTVASTDAPAQNTQTGAGGDPEGKLKPNCDRPPCIIPNTVQRDPLGRPLDSDFMNIPLDAGQIPTREVPGGRF